MVVGCSAQPLYNICNRHWTMASSFCEHSSRQHMML